MKTQTRRNLRATALILVVALLACIIAATLVACDENDGTNGDNGNNDYLVEYYDSLLEKMMGYGVTTYGWCNVTGFYGNEEKLGEGTRGYTYLYSETDGNSFMCEIFNYENENFANSNFELIKNDENILDGDYWNVFVDGNRIIAETKLGIYDDIKSFSGTIPSNVMTDKQKTFVKDALKATPDFKNLHGAIASIFLYDDYKLYEEDESMTGVQFGYDIWSLNDEYRDIYLCNFQIELDIDQNALMDGSYDKTENGIRYVYMRIKLETNE